MRDIVPTAADACAAPHGDGLRTLTLATLLLALVFVPFYLATLDPGWPIPRDGTGLVAGRDFLNFWMYGRAALGNEPARFYDLATYWNAVDAVAGAGYPLQQWSYPPSVMLVAAPFGAMPYFAALALWSAIGVTAFVVALRPWLNDRRLIPVLALAPAGVFGLMSGQFAFVATAAILSALRWRETRPVLAGIVLGLLTIKPQLGLFFPILLLATRNWRMIASAGVTASVLAGATALLWGPEVWTAYVRVGLGNQSLVLSDPAVLAGPFMPTVFMNARVAGLPVSAAGALQALGAIAAAALIWKTFADRPAATDLRANAVFLAGMTFGTPYLLSYDTLPLTVAAVLLMAQGGRGRLQPMLVYFLPLIQMVAGTHGVPGPAVIPIAFALWLGSRRAGRPDIAVSAPPVEGSHQLDMRGPAELPDRLNPIESVPAPR